MDVNDQNFPRMDRETFEAVNVAFSEIKMVLDIEKLPKEQEQFLTLLALRDMQIYSVNQSQDQELENLNACLTDSGIKLHNYLSVIFKGLSFAANHCLNIIKSVDDALKEHLAQWREKQKLAGNGDTEFDPGYLSLLQKMCEDPVEMARDILQFMPHAKSLLDFLKSYYEPATYAEQIHFLDNLSTHFIPLLRSLIITAFVIKNQPPQIIKKGSKFSAEVSSLVVGRLLENTNLPQPIQATIINEKQANFFVSNGTTQGSTCGEIILDEGAKMTFHAESKEFISQLGNMTLKRVKRSEKRGSESVVDEKFAIIFRANFTLIGNINIFAETMSLPITVIVHGSQEPQAMATILWDNGCSKSIRPLFNTPDIVSWKQLAEILSMKCHSITGKYLSPDDMSHLAQKLIDCKFMDDSMKLSWSKFCKENLPKRNFTFWDWFYNIMKLIKEHLKDLWTDNIIIDGFISKKQAETNLLQYSRGTFLLRFSDSILGGISIACVKTDQSGQKMVEMLNPYSSKTFAKTPPLANIIYDATSLLLRLYPNNISKEEAFRKHYKTVTDSLNFSTDNSYVVGDLFFGSPLNSFLRPSLNENLSSDPRATRCVYQTHSSNNVVYVYNNHHDFNNENATILQML